MCVGLGRGRRVGPAPGLCQDPRGHRRWRSLGSPRITQDLQASIPSCRPSSSLQPPSLPFLALPPPPPFPLCLGPARSSQKVLGGAKGEATRGGFA